MAKKRSTGFASRLKALREQSGMTQAQLAEKAGLHLMGLVKIEHGTREPAWSTVLAIAEALSVNVGEFVTDDEPKTDAPPRPRGRPPKAEAVPEPTTKRKRKKE